MDDDSKTSFPHWFKWVGSLLSVFIVIAICTYLYHFARNGFGDPEEFAWFGDYLGGLITPILTFFTICLLIWSIHIQLREFDLTRKEMKDTRIELAQTAKAQTESYDLQLKDVQYQQISSKLENIHLHFNSIWKMNFLRIDTRNTISFYSIFEDNLYADFGLIKQIKDQAKNMDQDIHTEMNIKGLMHDVRYHALMIAEFTCESYKYTYSPATANYEHRRAEEILEKLEKIGLISDEEFMEAKRIIKLPIHLHVDFLQ